MTQSSNLNKVYIWVSIVAVFFVLSEESIRTVLRLYTKSFDARVTGLTKTVAHKFTSKERIYHVLYRHVSPDLAPSNYYLFSPLEEREGITSKNNIFLSFSY